jgi:hypothetical protein
VMNLGFPRRQLRPSESQFHRDLGVPGALERHLALEMSKVGLLLALSIVKFDKCTQWEESYEDVEVEFGTRQVS